MYEGERVGSIILHKSTINDVISKYGSNYRVINHNYDSIELIYDLLGLGFCIRLDEDKKTVYHIRGYAPGKIKTTRGLIVGEHSLADAENIYGKSLFNLNCAAGSNIYTMSMQCGLILGVRKDDIKLSKRKLLKYYLNKKIIQFGITNHNE